VDFLTFLNQLGNCTTATQLPIICMRRKH
jgi:hypothetical protein